MLEIKDCNFCQIEPPFGIHRFLENEFVPESLGNNFIDDSFDVKKEPPSKKVKFVLTKPEPPISFLQKKTNQNNNITSSNSETEESNGGRWSKEEQTRFAEAVYKFGNDWKRIQRHVGTRNITQIRSHAQKFLMKLKENKFLQNRGFQLKQSWTKVMNSIRASLNSDELKTVLFSVEQGEERKKSKKNQQISENVAPPKEILKQNFKQLQFLSDYDCEIENQIKKEKENEDLQKLIDYFTSKSREITLNSSFEEESYENNKSNFFNSNFLNESEINYRNRFINW